MYIINQNLTKSTMHRIVFIPFIHLNHKLYKNLQQSITEISEATIINTTGWTIRRKSLASGQPIVSELLCT